VSRLIMIAQSAEKRLPDMSGLRQIAASLRSSQ
jgi:hypothetical protein